MLTLITCPTCHHRFTVPESEMGHRRTCPKCAAVFVAGKSVAESNGKTNGEPRRGLLERAAEELNGPRPGMDRTMLAEVEAVIRYNCPRCKKSLESPASEAGTKKPCPGCGGRLQVPAAAPPAAPANAGLNKTLLAESAPAPAFAPAPVPTVHAAPAVAVAATGPQPAAWKKYLVGGLAAAVVVLAVMYFVGKNNADREYEKYQQALAAQKAELDRLKADIEQKSVLLQEQQARDAQARSRWEEEKARQEARQRDFERERENELRRLTALQDEKQAAEAKARLEQRQKEIEDEKKRAADERAKAERDMRDQLDSLKRQLDAANQKSTTIIQPTPPVIYPWYYGPHPWHPWW